MGQAIGFFEIYDTTTFNKILDNPSGNYRIIKSFSFPDEPIIPIENFTGTLDGQGFTISNVHVPGGNAENIGGLFQTVSNAVIKNLNLEAAKNELILTRYEDQNVGLLAGHIKDSRIDNVHIGGADLVVLDGKAWHLNVAGLAAVITNTHIYRCVSTMNVCVTSSGTHQSVSGLTNFIDRESLVEQCAVFLNVDSTGHWLMNTSLVSGGSMIRDCIAVGNIKTNASGAAYTYAIQADTIERCLFSGSISNQQQNWWINNAFCYAGTTISNSVSIPSSLIGSNAALISRKIVADVPTTAPINTNNFSYTGSLINGQKVTADDPNSVHGRGKTLIELKNESTYTELGWDFEEVWKMGGGEDFPFPILKWLDEITLPTGYIPIK